MSFKEIFKLVLGWRLILIVIAIPAMFFLVSRPGFTRLTEKPSLENIFTMWSNFDGSRYLNLAKYGYDSQYTMNSDYAFFPVYPWVIRTFNVFDNYLASGLVLSHLFLIIALYLLYKLVLIDFKPKIAKSAIYLMLLFPTALFFGSVYTESLFLFLVVLSFYLARKKQFLFACVIAAIASGTRISGIFLWPAIAYEFWKANGESFKKSLNPKAIWLLLPPLGLFAYMRFQLIKTGNPVFFASMQPNFTGKSIDKLILLHQVFFRYAKMLIFTDHWDPLFFTVVLEIACAILLLIVLIFSFKKIRFSYWLFMLLSYLLPSFSGTFMSLPRYVVVLFPAFIYLAGWLDRQHPYTKYAYYASTVVFSIISIIFFTRGYFIG